MIKGNRDCQPKAFTHVLVPLCTFLSFDDPSRSLYTMKTESQNRPQSCVYRHKRVYVQEEQ